MKATMYVTLSDSERENRSEIKKAVQELARKMRHKGEEFSYELVFLSNDTATFSKVISRDK